MTTLNDMQNTLAALIAEYATVNRIYAEANRSGNKLVADAYTKQCALIECQLFDDYGLKVVDDIELSRAVAYHVFD